MKKSIFIFLLLAISPWNASAVLASSDYQTGLVSSIKNYGLSELVAIAKRNDPNSNVPYILEHMLTGLSMSTDPTATLEAIYPGALAASAIGQLIDKHGKDIANMSYNDRKVFIGGAYADPSLIPDSKTVETDPTEKLCRKMFDVAGGNAAQCRSYVAHIQVCNANKNPNTLQKEHCAAYLSEFYEHMQYEGKSPLVREAGKVASREIKNLGDTLEGQNQKKTSGSTTTVQDVPPQPVPVTGMLYFIATPPYGGGQVCLSAKGVARLKDSPVFKPLNKSCDFPRD